MDILYTENALLYPNWLILIGVCAILASLILLFCLMFLDHAKLYTTLLGIIVIGAIVLFVTKTKEVPVYCVQLNEEISFLEVYENYSIYEVVNEEDHIYKLIDIRHKGWEKWE